jgi:rhomboid protease GluP
MTAAPAATVAVSQGWEVEDAPADRPVLAFISFVPLVTLGLIGLLAAIYGLECVFGFEPGATQSIRSLVGLGGASRGLAIDQGQWWRALTSILLHGGSEHLIGNCFALFIAGLMLERRLGGAWFAAIFVIGGLAGSIASLLFNPANIVGVGASGAIMALLVPALIEAYGNETIHTIKRARAWVLFTVVTALIPTNAHIDYSAHMGGALAGGVLGYLLLFAAPELHNAAAGRRLAAAVAITGGLLALAGFGLVALHYPAYAARNAQLIPDGELQQLIAKPQATASLDRFSRATDLELKYPSDPRGHEIRAVILAQAENFVGAETEMRTALSQVGTMDSELPPDTARYMHGLLAMILFAEGRRDEGRAEARDICASRWPSPGLRAMRRDLDKGGVCRG